MLKVVPTSGGGVMLVSDEPLAIVGETKVMAITLDRVTAVALLRPHPSADVSLLPRVDHNTRRLEMS